MFAICSPRILYELSELFAKYSLKFGIFSNYPPKYASFAKFPRNYRLGLFANCSRINSRTNGLREQQRCSGRTREHLFATVREQISETQTPEYNDYERQTCSRRPPWYPWVMFIYIDILLSVYETNLCVAATHCEHSTQWPKHGNYSSWSSRAVAECVPIEADDE